MGISREFQNLFSQLKVQAGQELAEEERNRLRELQDKLRLAQLDWAKLQVRLLVFKSSDLVDQEDKPLRAEIAAIQKEIEQVEVRLFKLEEYLKYL